MKAKKNVSLKTSREKKKKKRAGVSLDPVLFSRSLQRQSAKHLQQDGRSGQSCHCIYV